MLAGFENWSLPAGARNRIKATVKIRRNTQLSDSSIDPDHGSKE